MSAIIIRYVGYWKILSAAVLHAGWGVLTLAVISAQSTLCAAPAVQAWVERYHGLYDGEHEPNAIAVDQNGNVFVTGWAMGSNGHVDWATVAYSSAGAPLWTNRYDGPAHSYDEAMAMALDTNSGNVYITGYSDQADGHSDWLTIAYSGAGAGLWTNRYNRAGPWPPSASADAILVGTNGNVYVAGHVGVMDADYAIVAYSSGGAGLWTNGYPGTNGIGSSADQVRGLAADESGRLYVTGWSDSWTGPDYLTIAYGPDGSALWTNRFSSPGLHVNTAHAVAVSRTGQVYVTGYSDGAEAGLDYATVAYSRDGLPLWTNRYSGPGNHSDQASSVAVDAHGNVYVTGGSVIDGHAVTATIAYTGVGAPLWTNLYDGSEGLGSGGSAVAVTAADRIYVAGYSFNQSGSDDYAVIAYSIDGTALWTNRYDGPGHGYDYIYSKSCLAVGADGAVYVSGASERVGGGGTNLDFATIKYVPAPDILLGPIERLRSGACLLRITAPARTCYRLEASSDLASWQTLTNFPPLPVSSMDYTDALAPGFVQRFYRAVWSP